MDVLIHLSHVRAWVSYHIPHNCVGVITYSWPEIVAVYLIYGGKRAPGTSVTIITCIIIRQYNLFSI